MTPGQTALAVTGVVMCFTSALICILALVTGETGFLVGAAAFVGVGFICLVLLGVSCFRKGAKK